MKPKVISLDWSDDIPDKLAAHGLNLDAPYDVHDDEPEFFPQDGREEEFRDGRPSRPARLLMIGQLRSGQLCRVVLEYPDEDGISLIVTGYPATMTDERRYWQRRGRRR